MNKYLKGIIKERCCVKCAKCLLVYKGRTDDCTECPVHLTATGKLSPERCPRFALVAEKILEGKYYE